MKKIVIGSLLSIFFASFFASPALAAHAGQYYVAGDFGAATYNNGPGYSNPNVFRIAGGYHFSPVFAFEVGYSTFGDSSAPDFSTISASSLQFAAVATLPLGPQFDLIGKVGVANNYEDFTVPPGNYTSFSQTDLLLGVGAQFNVNSQISLRAIYDDYGKFDTYVPPLKATSFSFGLVYNFY